MTPGLCSVHITSVGWLSFLLQEDRKMYSAVLMLALTAGSETADFGRHRCSGTTGCSAVAYGCSSYGCSSYGGSSYGCSSYGCSSSGHERRHLFGGHRNHGCSSSYGCSSSNGCSSSYGCSSSCHGGGLFSRSRHHGHGG